MIESKTIFKSYTVNKEYILQVLFPSSLTCHYLLQIRPEVPVPDELDEEESVDLSIPGPCYLRLLTITAPSVLPGDSYLATIGLALFSDFCLFHKLWGLFVCLLCTCCSLLSHRYFLSEILSIIVFYRDCLR